MSTITVTNQANNTSKDVSFDKGAVNTLRVNPGETYDLTNMQGNVAALARVDGTNHVMLQADDGTQVIFENFMLHHGSSNDESPVIKVNHSDNELSDTNAESANQSNYNYILPADFVTTASTAMNILPEQAGEIKQVVHSQIDASFINTADAVVMQHVDKNDFNNVNLSRFMDKNPQAANDEAAQVKDINTEDALPTDDTQANEAPISINVADSGVEKVIANETYYLRHEGDGCKVYKVDIADGQSTLTEIANFPSAEVGLYHAQMAISSDGSTLYITGINNSHKAPMIGNLFSYDLNSGEITHLVTDNRLYYTNALAIKNVDGKEYLYMTDNHHDNIAVYDLADITNGSKFPDTHVYGGFTVGDEYVRFSGGDIAFDEEGNLYVLTNDQGLLKLDLEALEAEVVNPLPGKNFSGLSYDPISQSFLVSGGYGDYFIEIDKNGKILGEIKATIDGEPFALNTGDAASHLDISYKVPVQFSVAENSGERISEFTIKLGDQAGLELRYNGQALKDGSIIHLDANADTLPAKVIFNPDTQTWTFDLLVNDDGSQNLAATNGLTDLTIDGSFTVHLADPSTELFNLTVTSTTTANNSDVPVSTGDLVVTIDAATGAYDAGEIAIVAPEGIATQHTVTEHYYVDHTDDGCTIYRTSIDGTHTELTKVVDIPESISGMNLEQIAVSSDGTKIYMTGGASSGGKVGSLMAYDIATGEIESIANGILPRTTTMTLNVENGKEFLYISDHKSGTIVAYDTSTFSDGKLMPAETFGPFTLADGKHVFFNGGDIAFDGDGNLYAVSIGTGLVKLDLNTCEAEIVNPLADYNHLSGISYDSADDSFILSGQANDHFIHIDKSGNILTPIAVTMNDAPFTFATGDMASTVNTYYAIPVDINVDSNGQHIASFGIQVPNSTDGNSVPELRYNNTTVKEGDIIKLDVNGTTMPAETSYDAANQAWSFNLLVNEDGSTNLAAANDLTQLKISGDFTLHAGNNQNLPTDIVITGTTSANDSAVTIAFAELTMALGEEIPPTVVHSSIEVSADNPYIFDMSDFILMGQEINDSVVSIQPTNLPDGIHLQLFDGNDWLPVNNNDIIQVDDINAGYLRFVAGNDAQDGFNFEYQMFDGADWGYPSALTIDAMDPSYSPMIECDGGLKIAEEFFNNFDGLGDDLSNLLYNDLADTGTFVWDSLSDTYKDLASLKDSLICNINNIDNLADISLDNLLENSNIDDIISQYITNSELVDTVSDAIDTVGDTIGDVADAILPDSIDISLDSVSSGLDNLFSMNDDSILF